MFEIEPVTGLVKLLEQPAAGSVHSWEVETLAIDDGHCFACDACDQANGPVCVRNSARGTLRIKQQRLLNHRPSITNCSGLMSFPPRVSEAALPGTLVVTVRASDVDWNEAGLITFKLSEKTGRAPEFHIDKKTGAITTVRAIDRETVHDSSFNYITVFAVDNGSIPVTASDSQ